MDKTYKSWQMVDRDDGHSWVSWSNVDFDGWLWERGVDGWVDRDGIVWVGGATRE